MDRYIYIGLTLALTAYGQLVLKSRALELSSLAAAGGKSQYLIAMLTDKFVISGLVAAVIAAMCWMLAVEKTSLSYAYPFMALSFVLVPAISAWLFGESLSNLQLVGLTLIVAGVSLNAFSQ